MSNLERLRRVIATHHDCAWRQVRVSVELYDGWMWLVYVQLPGRRWSVGPRNYYRTRRIAIELAHDWYTRTHHEEEPTQ